MRPPRPSSMVEIACQSARHFRFFLVANFGFFLHILVPKKCRVLQLAIRGTFPGLNWVSVPPKLPFVSLCRPMVSCQRHSSLKQFWRCTSDGLLVKDAPICAASNDMQGGVHLGGSKIAARRKLQCAAHFGGAKSPRVASCNARRILGVKNRRASKAAIRGDFLGGQ